MTNEEYVRQLGMLYNATLSLRGDDDYIVNDPQMDKLCRAIAFFADQAVVLDGEVDPVALVPREEHGGLTATFVVFDLSGEACREFAEIAASASALDIDSLEDGRVSISLTIPDVFIQRRQQSL